MDLKGFLLTTMIESCGVNPWSPSIDDRMDFLNDVCEDFQSQSVSDNEYLENEF